MLKFNLFSRAFLLIAISSSLTTFAYAENNTAQYVSYSQMKMRQAPDISYDFSAEECSGKQPYNLVTSMKIDRQGNVMTIGIVKSSGNYHLDKTVLQGLKTAKFYPFMKHGVPVAVLLKLPFRFIC